MSTLKKQSGNSTIKWILWGIFFIVLIFTISSEIKSCKRNNSENDKTPTENITPQKQQEVPKRVRTNKLFNFDNTREFSVPLEAGWKTFPKGGKIKIKTPSGSCLYDKPGVRINFGYQPNGIYVFYAVEKNTTGVVINNFW